MTHSASELNQARKFFEASHQAARESGYELGVATWFQIEGRPSVHFEEVYGFSPTYSVD